MVYRNKTYIAFDGDNDIRYYRLMKAWRDNENHDFNFHDAHDINTARDNSSEESIKRQLRERFANSRMLIVLIGEDTWRLTKFVQWEIETAIRLDLPIVAVNLNGSKNKDNKCPPALQGELALFVPFNQKAIMRAMDIWSSDHERYRREGMKSHFELTDAVYRQLESSP